MSARHLCVSLAVVGAAAALLAGGPVVTAKEKDDPAAIAATRLKIRDEYVAKKVYPTADLSYAVDSAKLKDGRWVIRVMPAPENPDQGHMFSADFPSGNATDASSSIQFNVFKCIQYKMEGKARSNKQYEFKAWGKSVPMTDVEQFATGLYEDWIRLATDVIKDKGKRPDNKGTVGPAKYWGYAVGTDKDEKKRVRKDWYVWVQNGSAGAFTWWAEVTTAEKFVDNPDWIAKIEDMMKNFKELNDKRLK